VRDSHCGCYNHGAGHICFNDQFKISCSWRAHPAHSIEGTPLWTPLFTGCRQQKRLIRPALAPYFRARSTGLFIAWLKNLICLGKKELNCPGSRKKTQ
jgi:hypothetical protein